MTRKDVKNSNGLKGECPQKLTPKTFPEYTKWCKENKIDPLLGLSKFSDKNLRGIHSNIFRNKKMLENSFRKYKEFYHTEDFCSDEHPRPKKGIVGYSTYLKNIGQEWTEDMGEDYPIDFGRVIDDNTPPDKDGDHVSFVTYLTGVLNEKYGESEIGGTLSGYYRYDTSIWNSEGQPMEKLLPEGSMMFWRRCFLLGIENKKFLLEFVPKGENGIELYKILIKDGYRGLGLGTEIMELITTISDVVGLDLYLNPSPFYLKEDERIDRDEFGKFITFHKRRKLLRKFYSKFGFNKLDGIQIMKRVHQPIEILNKVNKRIRKKDKQLELI